MFDSEDMMTNVLFTYGTKQNVFSTHFTCLSKVLSSVYMLVVFISSQCCNCVEAEVNPVIIVVEQKKSPSCLHRN